MAIFKIHPIGGDIRTLTYDAASCITNTPAWRGTTCTIGTNAL
ncbi:hypothetical protein [Nitrosomonas sp.]|nr:hypothetical protein [Nitrosomonas sp.]